jgi:hypothetical protein
MSGLTLRLTELRPLIVPLSQFLVWPIFFLITSAVSQQPAYFLALMLVLAADVFDSSPRNRGLVRDAIAGISTAVLATFLTDLDAIAIGAVVCIIAASRLYQKLS